MPGCRRRRRRSATDGILGMTAGSQERTRLVTCDFTATFGVVRKKNPEEWNWKMCDLRHPAEATKSGLLARRRPLSDAGLDLQRRRDPAVKGLGTYTMTATKRRSTSGFSRQSLRAANPEELDRSRLARRRSTGRGEESSDLKNTV